jgi:hypothetical protein
MYTLRFSSINEVKIEKYEDNLDLAYSCFLEMLNVYLAPGGIANLLRYFGREEMWFIDIVHATCIASDNEQHQLSQVLVRICEEMKVDTELDKEVLHLIDRDYTSLLQRIISKEEPEDNMERYVRFYSSTKIPSIIQGALVRA